MQIRFSSEFARFSSRIARLELKKYTPASRSECIRGVDMKSTESYLVLLFKLYVFGIGEPCMRIATDNILLYRLCAPPKEPPLFRDPVNKLCDRISAGDIHLYAVIVYTAIAQYPGIAPVECLDRIYIFI